LNYVWRDEGYSSHIKKVFIIGVSPKPVIRRIFEREFVNQLKSHGVDAVASHQVIPSDEMLDKETIVSKIKDLDIDTVLITRLAEKKTTTTYFNDWYGYYSGSHRIVYKEELVSLETNLYEVRTEKLIWSALSETVLFQELSIYKKIQSLVEVMVKHLSEEKFIKT
jgi:hypothetical protein